MLDVSFEFGFKFPDWHRDALCQEFPEVEFFPDRGEDARPAKAICQRCLVQSDCLSWALEQGTLDGIWGGTSKRERKMLRASNVTGELVRRYGAHAVQGRTFERERDLDRQYEALMGL